MKKNEVTAIATKVFEEVREFCGYNQDKMREYWKDADVFFVLRSFDVSTDDATQIKEEVNTMVAAKIG